MAYLEEGENSWQGNICVFSDKGERITCKLSVGGCLTGRWR